MAALLTYPIPSCIPSIQLFQYININICRHQSHTPISRLAPPVYIVPPAHYRIHRITHRELPIESARINALNLWLTEFHEYWMNSCMNRYIYIHAECQFAVSLLWLLMELSERKLPMKITYPKPCVSVVCAISSEYSLCAFFYPHFGSKAS